MTTQTLNLFLRRVPALMLIELGKEYPKKKYCLQLTKEIGCTHTHSSAVLNSLEDIGLIIFDKKQGRVKVIKLTKKGRFVSQKIAMIIDKMNVEWLEW